jgi:hypothetical protein
MELASGRIAGLLRISAERSPPIAAMRAVLTFCSMRRVL